MAQSLSKYFAVWFGFALAIGAVLYFLNGDSTSLNPSIENGMLKGCQEQISGFSSDQTQQCLEQVAGELLTRALEVRSDLMLWFGAGAVTVLIVGLLFMVRVTQRSAMAGSPVDFRSMRGAWFGHLLSIAVLTVAYAALAHVGSMFATWGVNLTQSRGWGIPAFLIAAWCLSFWLGTLVATPTKMKPSIPGG